MSFFKCEVQFFQVKITVCVCLVEMMMMAAFDEKVDENDTMPYFSTHKPTTTIFSSVLTNKRCTGITVILN